MTRWIAALSILFTLAGCGKKVIIREVPVPGDPCLQGESDPRATRPTVERETCENPRAEVCLSKGGWIDVADYIDRLEGFVGKALRLCNNERDDHATPTPD